MTKNRMVQLIFQTVYCTIGLMGTFDSIGFFDMKFNKSFYVYFTNWSNYFCVGIMFVELIQTIKKNENSYVSAVPILKFIGLLGILLTFLVFNLLLASEPSRNPALNYKLHSVTFHIVLPLMYIIDWLLFYQRGQLKWTYPIYSAIFPIIYIIFIFVRAWIINVCNLNKSVSVIYPYFFLNVNTQGLDGVVHWCVVLSLAFIILGFLFVFLDRVVKSAPLSHTKSTLRLL